MTSDYKKYSLDKLKEWIHDAMNSDASPHEIYSAIREAVREDYYYHKDCISRASGLLELLSGHRPVSISATGEEFYDDFECPLPQQYTEEELNAMCDKATSDEEKEKCREYNVREEEYYSKSQNGVTHKEYTKAKIEANSAWNDGWTKQYYQKIVDKYEGKQPKKWVLPVEQSVVDGVDDYYIQFPDDLLEAANLKEGDQVEWVDQGDGSCLIKKVPMTYDEMVAAGWTMTADGFWIKE